MWNALVILLFGETQDGVQVIALAWRAGRDVAAREAAGRAAVRQRPSATLPTDASIETAHAVAAAGILLAATASSGEAHDICPSGTSSA